MLNLYESISREIAIKNAGRKASAPNLADLAPDLERPALIRSCAVDVSFVKDEKDNVTYNGTEQFVLPV